MKYHKKLRREDLIKYGWKNVILMIASEYSRASNLSINGKSKEVENCVKRAKELFGVLESSFDIPWTIGCQLLSVMKNIAVPPKNDYQLLYQELTNLASVNG